MVDVTVQGLTVPNSPLVAKAYDAAMIRVTDIQDGHVGVLSTFRVDASRYFSFWMKKESSDSFNDMELDAQMIDFLQCFFI